MAHPDVSGHGAMLNKYSQFSKGQHTFLNQIETFVLGSLKKTSIAGRRFVICDYGAADGLNSFNIFGKCINQLRKDVGEDLQIEIVFEDQPSNDFKPLFEALNEGDLKGGQKQLQADNVFVSAIGKSFYQQVVPDATVNFAFSATAFHWLSKTPCPIKHGINFRRSEADEEEQRLFTEQAAQDWETILLHREKEMSPGGIMVVGCFGEDPYGNVTLGRNSAATVNYLWRGMLTDNIISNEEFLRTCFANRTCRTEEDFRAPFGSPESPVVKSGLMMLNLHWMLVEDSLKEEWLSKAEHDRDETAAREFGRKFVGRLKIWGYNTILGGLDRGRREQEKREIVDTLYKRYEDLVAENPEAHEVEYVYAVMLIKKNPINS